MVRRAMALVAMLLVASIAATRVNAAESLLVVGPVESIDVSQGVLQVLGQTVRLTSQTRVYVGSLANSAHATRTTQRAIRTVDAGQMVAVWSSDGNAASVILISRERSVPGSTQVYVSGKVTSVDPLRGVATVGGTTIDLTSTLYRGPLEVSVGDALQVLGTQPLPNGVVLASNFSIGGSSTSGIGGSSTNGIGGSSTNGIGGSSTNGIGGSSTSGIGGSSTS